MSNYTYKTGDLVVRRSNGRIGRIISDPPPPQYVDYRPHPKEGSWLIEWQDTGSRNWAYEADLDLLTSERNG